jgi:hypothetical protein
MATIHTEVPRGKTGRRPKRVAKDPRGPNWGRLVAEGRAARGAADAGRWRIGHLASLVVKQYGARSVQGFAEDIGESYSTVRRYRWVYKSYEPSIRFRFQQLSFSHFQAVAGLPDRVKWLEQAETGCWSVDRLTEESRSAGGRPSKRTLRDRRARTIRDADAELQCIAAFGDAEIKRASGWLEPLLDELADSMELVRQRLRKVNGVRTGGYRSNGNGNGHRGRANGNGNGHRSRAKARA